ncbi:MAG TPA: HIRAN domain-containing protein [Rhodanobacteraceae bacterium]
METQSNHPERGAVAAADGASKPRRRFLGALVASIGGPLLAAVTPVRARAPSHRLHLQDCRIAGSHHCDCHKVLAHLRLGDALRLRRQTDNPHDSRAIEVFWRKHKLGYLPRRDNAAAASLADRAYSLHAEIIGIDDPDEQWEPVRLRVWVSNT